MLKLEMIGVKLALISFSQLKIPKNPKSLSLKDERWLKQLNVN